jgi:hypothetical protein
LNEEATVENTDSKWQITSRIEEWRGIGNGGGGKYSVPEGAMGPE